MTYDSFLKELVRDPETCTFFSSAPSTSLLLHIP